MHPIIKESDFRKEMKATPRTGYLFFGDEDYLKFHALKQASETICPDPTYAFFNEMHLDAVDFTPDKLLDALMPMPMMADRKLVTVRGLNFNTMRQSDLDNLCDVLSTLSEYDYNLLIICAAADCLDAGFLPKKPSPALSALGEHLTPVQFDRCSSAKLATWIQRHFAHNGVEASPAFCNEMPNYCGHSMFVLANEIDKLSYYLLAHGETSATAEAMRLVCTSTEEYDAFAFTNAIMDGKQEAALAILADYRLRRIEPVFILGDMIRVICEMISVQAMTAEGLPASEIGSAFRPPLHEYKVGLYQKSLRNTSEKRLRRALNACLDADASLKSSAKGYAPLEKLICTL